MTKVHLLRSTSAGVTPSLFLATIIAGPVLGAPPPAAARPTAKPDVYAIVIGVSKYPDNVNAKNAESAARRFADAVQQTYGKEALKYLFLGKDANAADVRKALFKLRGAPPGSLIIAYFAGHGHRQVYGTDKATLFLRLAGSRTDAVEADSVELADLWKPLAYSNFTNGMIFVDCCFAGADDKDLFAELELNLANAKMFMMCACGNSEQTVGDTFTNALLKTWEEERASAGKRKCMTLDQFEAKVRKAVADKDNRYAMPGVRTKTRFVRCLANMLEESSLLLFTFPRGCSQRLAFSFNDDGSEDVFSYREDRFFVTQVARREKIKVTVTGPGNRKLLDGFVIDPSQNPRRVIEFEVPVPEELVSRAANDAIDRLNIAATIEGFGEASSTSDAYVKAAEARTRSLGVCDNSSLIRKAFVYAKANPVLRCAHNESALETAEVERMVRIGTVGFDVVQSLERIGANVAAAKTALQFGDALRNDPAARADLLVRAAGNLRIAQAAPVGDLAGLENQVRAALTAEPLTTRQRTLVARIESHNPVALGKLWIDVPRREDEWSRIAFDRPEAVAKLSEFMGKENVLAYAAADSPLGVGWMCALQDFGLLNTAVGRNKIFVHSSALPPNDFPVEAPTKMGISVASPSWWDAKTVANAKPGFQIMFGGDSALVYKPGLAAGSPRTNGRFKLNGNLGVEIIAMDAETAKLWESTKVDYTTVEKDGKFYIRSLKKEKVDPNNPLLGFGTGYEVQVHGAAGTWTNVFSDRQTAEEFGRLPNG